MEWLCLYLYGLVGIYVLGVFQAESDSDLFQKLIMPATWPIWMPFAAWRAWSK